MATSTLAAYKPAMKENTQADVPSNKSAMQTEATLFKIR
jgi:hypothetical protein